MISSSIWPQKAPKRSVGKWAMSKSFWDGLNASLETCNGLILENLQTFRAELGSYPLCLYHIRATWLVLGSQISPQFLALKIALPMGLLWSGLCMHMMHLHLLKPAHKQNKQIVPNSVKNPLCFFVGSAHSQPLLESGSRKLSAPFALLSRALPSSDTNLKEDACNG